MRILTTPRFDRAIKKLHKEEKQALDDAIRVVITDSDIGELKKGDLAGVRVYKSLPQPSPFRSAKGSPIKFAFCTKFW
jgi:hypothetical protein